MDVSCEFRQKNNDPCPLMNLWNGDCFNTNKTVVYRSFWLQGFKIDDDTLNWSIPHTIVMFYPSNVAENATVLWYVISDNHWLLVVRSCLFANKQKKTRCSLQLLDIDYLVQVDLVIMEFDFGENLWLIRPTTILQPETSVCCLSNASIVVADDL